MKNQYLAIVIFIAFSIISCGNSTEDAATDEQAVEEQTDVVVEEKVESLEDEVEAPANETIEIATAEKKEIIIVEDDDEADAEYQVVYNTPATEGKPLATPPVEVKETVLIEKPNHTPWDDLTKKYVTASGKVNYKGMKGELSKINSYLTHLKNTPPKSDWSKNEKLAYWINLYNASTVHLIVSNYPTSSITKLNGGKPWDKKFVKSGTKTYSLNDIEHKIVRPTFKDPRVHAALNCAAVSCPKLLNGAYLPSKLNAQLDKQTRAWINDATKNKLGGNKAQVSQLFDWYKEDFKGGIIPFINKYISTGVALEPKAKITYLEYDWALNE
jgi:uncharacterized protein DUF547